MSGVTRQSYAPEIRIIRLMCTGRVDLAFILRALIDGADGVIIGGCWPGECHYVTEGNYDALANVHLAKKLLQKIGFNPDRVRLEWIAASEGNRFAELMTDFAETLAAAGPPCNDGGLDAGAVKLKLEAVNQLVPYVKLVEREKLRVPVKSEEAYNQHFASERVNQLFDQMIDHKLVLSQILMLLEARPRSTAEIADALGLDASEVAKHMNSSSRQGLVSYDLNEHCFALARSS